jgi:nucleoside-diphosphate-sugar epimerase
VLVAITGGNGDLGRAMQKRAPAGVDVRAIDQKPNATVPQADYRQADVLDLNTFTEALRDADAVVHLAAYRSPRAAPPETVFYTNTQGTYHITLACEALGIKHIVYASSICYFGYIFRADLTSPSYFPVDESMPALPEDSYSLSKCVGEEIMKAFVQRTDGAVASLRYAYLLPGGATGEPLARDSATDMTDHASSAKIWWTYIDMADAADVTWQALQYLGDKHHMHEAFNIGADDTHALTHTAELVKVHYPQVELRYGTLLESTPHTALYSNARARRLLGFRPTAPIWRDRAQPRH